MTERLTDEHEATYRQWAKGEVPESVPELTWREEYIVSELIMEIDALRADLDAVREELDEANDVYNIVQDIGEALGVPHGSVIAIHAPLLAKQLRADLTSANERVRVLEHALREAVGALSALGIALPDEKMLLAQ